MFSVVCMRTITPQKRGVRTYGLLWSAQVRLALLKQSVIVRMSANLQKMFSRGLHAYDYAAKARRAYLRPALSFKNTHFPCNFFNTAFTV